MTRHVRERPIDRRDDSGHLDRPLVSDGFVEFTTDEANTARMAGLSSGNGGPDDADIDFAIRLSDSGLVAVLERGINRGGSGTHAPCRDPVDQEAVLTGSSGQPPSG